MSKNVKYFSSDHFGAPPLKGDRWGYLVEMLRAVLCTGFNTRSDVSKVEVVSSTRIKITFGSIHNYSVQQTISLSGTVHSQLNAEYVVKSVNGLTITVDNYDSSIVLSPGTILDGLSGVSTKVAPLGFIEKYTDVAGRSVFTTDEDEAYLYIDDVKPDTWDTLTSEGFTPQICPLVFMTDKMTDINTVTGSCIVPFQAANPTYYKLKEYKLSATYDRTGLWQWQSFGMYRGNVNSNTAEQAIIPAKWTLIGNGRLFYFIPELNDFSTTAIQNSFYMFGKINSARDNTRDLPYILSGRSDSATTRSHYDTLSSFGNNAITPSLSNSSAETVDTGQNNFGMLKIRGTPSKVNGGPSPWAHVIDQQPNLVSGNLAQTMSYPDNLSFTYNIGSIYLNNKSEELGKISGLKWIFNANQYVHFHRMVKEYNFGDNKKTLFFYIGQTTIGTVAQTSVYNISLNNEDWYNYD